MTAQTIDVAEFAVGGLGYSGPLHMIVKSLDQVERRARLVDAKRRGRIGRIEERPIATGLWAQVSGLGPGCIDRSTASVIEFREPRGLVQCGPDRFLLAEVSSVVLVDAAARIEKRFTHPFFAFLHSLSFDQARGRFLVVSSGYDCLIEMDLNGQVTWEWSAWEHGSNPSLDGVYLCRSAALVERYTSEGKNAVLVDPAQQGEYGLMTSQRSNHPNSACYHPTDDRCVLATLGHSGEVIQIDRDSGEARTVISGLEAMPHGIQPYGDGWLVTNTLRGEFWLMDRDFALRTVIATRNLSGKPRDMTNHEWLQATYPLRDGWFVAADANRGLIAIDVNRRTYQIHSVDESWCVHHIVALTQ